MSVCVHQLRGGIVMEQLILYLIIGFVAALVIIGVGGAFLAQYYATRRHKQWYQKLTGRDYDKDMARYLP